MFEALRYRDYRLYWVGGLVSFVGSWVQSVCYSWLIYDITGSKAWLGYIGFAGSLPLLVLSLFGGALIDRMNKRRALMATQGMFAVFALILGLLVSHGVIDKHNPSARYYIMAVAFLQGIVLSIDQPIRQSMPGSLVPRENMMNAIVLNSAAFNIARISGPALGAWLMNVNVAYCFYANSVSFLAVIVSLMMMRIKLPAIARQDTSLFHDFLDGLRYIRREPKISKLMFVISASALFVMPYMTLMPVFAKDILHAGKQGMGALFTSVGIGAVIGALVLARLSSMPRRGRMLLISSGFGSLLLAAFANSRSLILSEAILVGLGFMVVSFNQMTNSLIQQTADEAYRSRVMSAYVFIFLGLSPIANLQAGILAEHLGAPMAVTIWSGVFLATAIYIATQRDLLHL